MSLNFFKFMKILHFMKFLTIFHIFLKKLFNLDFRFITAKIHKFELILQILLVKSYLLFNVLRISSYFYL